MVAPHTSLPLDDAKRQARLAALASRAAAVSAGQDAAACGAALAQHVLAACPPPAGAIVAGFLPIGDEIDLRPLLRTLHERGHTIVLPVTPPRGQPLSFRIWTPETKLVTERFGTQAPTGPFAEPDFLLVPLLAFDARGHRLGYGAGYYDRTLAGLRDRFSLGCAYAAQQVETVPTGPHDIPLDAVATEHGVIRCPRQ